MMENKINLSKIFYFIALGIYLVTTILGTSLYAPYINPHYRLAIMVSVVLLIISEFGNKKVTWYELSGACLFVVLTFLLMYHFSGYAYLPIFLFAYVSRNFDFRSMAKCIIIITGLLLSFIVFSSQIGIIQDYTYITSSRERHCLGFRYVLYSQMFLFNIITLVMYLNKNNSIFVCIIMEVINYMLFKFTDARLSFYLSTLLILFCYIYRVRRKRGEKIGKKIYQIMSLAFIICCICSLVLIMCYDDENMSFIKLNDYLGDRLRLGKESLQIYDISMFGHNVQYSGWGLNQYGELETSLNQYMYVDCMYLNICEKYGVIFMFLYIFIFTFASIQAYRNRDYIVEIILFFMAVHGMIDDLQFNFCYNSWYLIIGYYLKNMVIKKVVN